MVAITIIGVSLTGLTDTRSEAQEPTSVASPAAAPPGGPPPIDAYAARRSRSIEAKWNVTVDVEMVTLPQELALLLIPDLQSSDEKTVEGAVRQIQDLLKKKQAILMAWPMVICLDGDRSTTESNVEERYPSEFEPPQTPQTVSVGPPPPKSPITLVPSSFETRNTGATLEVEPVVLPGGQRMHLSLAANRVELLGFTTLQPKVSSDGIEVKTEQPRFASYRVTTQVKINSGQHLLVGVHQMAAPEHHVELVILHATATELK